MTTEARLQQMEAPLAVAGAMPDRVVVINDVSLVRGGATSVALLSAQLLSARGIPVTLITGEDAPTSFSTGEATFDVAAIGSAHILKGGRLAASLRGIYNRRTERFLSRWIAVNDSPRTVYHLHGWSKVLSPSVFRALQPVKSRLVVHAHDFFLTCPNGGYFDFRRGCACELRPLSMACIKSSCDRRHYAHKLWRAVRLAVRRAFYDPEPGPNRILAVHEGMHGLLEYGGLKRCSLGVLRNPVVPWRTDRIPAERNRTFLFVGRLDEDKGADIVARAARLAGVPLRMIGTGPLADILKRDFAEIEIVGWKTREEIAKLCLDARAVVMPTRSRETFGLVALEAMISGLPVILSATAMLAPELVANNFGLTCDPQNATALADIMGRMAEDDVLVAAMSRNAHANARRLAPTPAEWTNKLLAMYQALLERPSNEGLRIGSCR